MKGVDPLRYNSVSLAVAEAPTYRAADRAGGSNGISCRLPEIRLYDCVSGRFAARRRMHLHPVAITVRAHRRSRLRDAEIAKLRATNSETMPTKIITFNPFNIQLIYNNAIVFKFR